MSDKCEGCDKPSRRLFPSADDVWLCPTCFRANETTSGDSACAETVDPSDLSASAKKGTKQPGGEL